jgi:hypothetical protein
MGIRGIDKHKFMKLAPMYYALAIAARLQETENGEYLTGDVIVDSYSPSPMTTSSLIDIAVLFDHGMSILRRYGMIEILPDPFGPPLVRKSANFDNQFIMLCRESNTPFVHYSLAKDGAYQWMESALRSVNSRFQVLQIENKDFAEDPDWEQIPFDNIEQEQITFKTPIDEWEPLPLDRTDEKLQAAIGALDETVEQLRSTNGYAATHPEERSYVLDKLQAVTRRLKEDTQISWMYLRDFALEPLGMLMKRFTNAALGMVVAAARAMLKEWLKRVGVNFLDDVFGE